MRPSRNRPRRSLHAFGETTRLPVALGFGISTPEHVREVTAYADAAVVGSALVQVIAQATSTGVDVGAEVERFVGWLKGS